jgi:hypothetical protein
MQHRVIWGFAAVATVGLLRPGWTAPPPDADPALAPWFESLHKPGTDQSCCGVADCRRVRYRIAGDHFQAFIGDEFPRWTATPHAWVDVPDTSIVRRQDNPTGEAVACWYQGNLVCFVPASGT